MDFQSEKMLAQQNMMASISGGVYPATIREQIMREISNLETQLSKKREMLQLLDENPAIERFMNLLR